MKLPKQFPSWYAFWLHLKNAQWFKESNHQRVRFHYSRNTTEDYDVSEIKAKALDEVSKFLPTNTDEVFMRVAASNLLEDMRGEERTGKWYEFHKLLNQ